MKAIIWLVYFVVLSVIEVLLKEQGIVLGAIPTGILWAALALPTALLSNNVDIKKYKKKFPNGIVNDMLTYIDFCNSDFLIKKNLDINDDNIEFFNLVKIQISTLTPKKTNQIMAEIIESDSSPSAYVLNIMEKQALEEIKKGDVREIINQKGGTYILFKIYEYTNDIQLENGTLTPIQYKNKLEYIEQICNDKK